MSLATRALLSFVCAAAVAAAADSSLINMAMPDAKTLAGAHISQAVNSPLGQHLLSQMPGQGARDFDKFMAATGFDPRRDLTEVLVASPDAGQPSHKTGLVMATGVFDVSRILAAAVAEGAPHAPTTTKYRGADVLVNTENGESQWVAFPNSTTAVMGPQDAVKAALDRRNSSSTVDPKLLAKVADLGSRYDAWFVSSVPVSQIAPSTGDPNLNGAFKGDMFKSIQQVSGGVKFGLTVQISGEAVTNTDKDATALADVIRFFANMVQMNKGKNDSPLAASILNTLDLRTDANVMKLSLAIAESDLEQLMQSAPHHPHAKKAAALRAR